MDAAATQLFDRLTLSLVLPAGSASGTPPEPSANTLQTGRCAARNRKGDPCAAPALRGAELCLAHSGKTRLDSAKGAARSAEVRRVKAQARRETLQDKLARELDEHADEVVAAYLAGISPMIRTALTGRRMPDLAGSWSAEGDGRERHLAGGSARRSVHDARGARPLEAPSGGSQSRGGPPAGTHNSQLSRLRKGAITTTSKRTLRTPRTPASALGA